MKIQRTLPLLLSLVFGWLAVSASAADHRIEVLNEPAPADAVAKDVAAALSPSGYRVIRGTSRTVCDIWLCKEWEVKAEDLPAGVNYPFQPGQLIGVARYPRNGADFRDQEIDDGLYTLRYAQQPIDGNHVGTSPTRDFLLLIEADKDTSPKTIDYDELAASSAEAAGTSHPCLLSMQRVAEDAKAPSARHEERHDWWIACLQGSAKADGAAKDLRLDVVVVGYAAE